MTRDAIRKLVLDVLSGIAPEADTGTLKDTADLRDELDLDSMDMLGFATALHEKLGIDIPERDYARIASLGSCIEYLATKLRD